MKKLKNIFAAITLFSIGIAATSCDNSFVYEEGEDCFPKVQFIFKKHRQALGQIEGRETDVFYSMVGTVHLFVYDAETGELVYEKAEATDNLQTAAELKLGEGTDRCFMDLDLNPGKYKFVAWCGLDESDNSNAFELVDNTRAGRYTHCRVKKRTDGHPVNGAKYDALYHGVVNEFEIVVEKAIQVIPVELTKNTNEISVCVQHTTQSFEEGDYEVVYTDANGELHFENNSITDNSRLEYHPYESSILTAQTEYNGNLAETGALFAHLSTSRLMDANKDDARIEVRDKNGKTVFSVPFIKYVLEMQTFVGRAGSKASERDYQYYLDCEDTYNCTFYLSGETKEGEMWVPSMIIINNWVKVPDQKVEF